MAVLEAIATFKLFRYKIPTSQQSRDIVIQYWGIFSIRSIALHKSLNKALTAKLRQSL